ncbi:unnamed protein product [Schistosoma margrebowiei]|uniref:Uncharacterized protein n=1 Tax=Schistosoma margrebowiei TaxID=48269 RepID=A0A183MQX3_9TREM|nr:unnamed protein product [Schistosoma margrebowiei]
MEARSKTKKEGSAMNVIQRYAPFNYSNDDDEGHIYERLQSIRTKCSGNDSTNMMGYLNAKVLMGNTGYEDIMGRHGLTRRKEPEGRQIRKFMCIQQNGHRRHNIPTQTRTQS